MPLPKVELSDVDKILLQTVASELLHKLAVEEKEALHVKGCAFGFYEGKNKEEYQVQVLVTRCQKDFLDPFQTEVMENYKFKKPKKS